MLDDDDDAEDIDYGFDTEDDQPLFVFRSVSGRIFISAVRPPEGFRLSGDVGEVGDFFIIDEERPIPTINWIHDEPAILYQLPDSQDFAIGFPDGDGAPTGYETLGGDFAFVIDEEGLKRAIEEDR